MKTQGFSSPLAIALSGLALILAAGGTAVAVTNATSIEDPDVPGRFAHVDASGRLNTVNATSRLNYSKTLYAPSINYYFATTPTNAQIAVTNISISHGSIYGAAGDGTSYRVYLYRATVEAGTTNCGSITEFAQLRSYVVGPTDDVEADFSSPLLVRPKPATKYCLLLYTEVAGGPNGSNNAVVVSMSAFVASGAYNGPGSAARSSQRKPGVHR